jgi:hypothetical protein
MSRVYRTDEGHDPSMVVNDAGLAAPSVPPGARLRISVERIDDSGNVVESKSFEGGNGAVRSAAEHVLEGEVRDLSSRVDRIRAREDDADEPTDDREAFLARQRGDSSEMSRSEFLEFQRTVWQREPWKPEP